VEHLEQFASWPPIAELDVVPGGSPGFGLADTGRAARHYVFNHSHRSIAV